MNSRQSAHVQFNADELQILSDFLHLYGIIDIGKPLASDVKQERKTDVIQTIADTSYRLFDPLCKYYANTNYYLQWLSLMSVDYVFVVDSAAASNYINNATEHLFPYIIHIELTLYYTSCFSFIDMSNQESSKPSDKPKLLLLPYIYTDEQLQSYQDISKSQAIPFTNNPAFNSYIFELWLELSVNEDSMGL